MPRIEQRLGGDACRRHGAACALLAALTSTCVLTDEAIGIVRSEQLNEHAVRLVEPVTLTDHCSCDDASDEEECNPECPLPRGPGLPHFLDPEAYPFCECEIGKYDARYLNPLEFYAEDEDNEPAADANAQASIDQIYAALLLDWDRSAPASKHVAYRDLHTGRFLYDRSAYDDAVEEHGRPSPQTRRLFVGNERGIDLCNDHGTGVKMATGYHTLTVLVTDRPWYAITPPGSVELIPQVGVPDIASGATWDRLDYVFHCSDSDEPPFSCSQNCL